VSNISHFKMDEKTKYISNLLARKTKVTPRNKTGTRRPNNSGKLRASGLKIELFANAEIISSPNNIDHLGLKNIPLIKCLLLKDGKFRDYLMVTSRSICCSLIDDLCEEKKLKLTIYQKEALLKLLNHSFHSGYRGKKYSLVKNQNDHTLDLYEKLRDIQAISSFQGLKVSIIKRKDVQTWYSLGAGCIYLNFSYTNNNIIDYLLKQVAGGILNE